MSDRRIILRDIEYLGGHPSAPNPLGKLDVEFSPAGITFLDDPELLGSIPWSGVVELNAEAQIERRSMTLPRLFLFGWLLAFLFKKREIAPMMRIRDQRGTWVFEVWGLSLEELRAGLEEACRRWMPPLPPPPNPPELA